MKENIEVIMKEKVFCFYCKHYSTPVGNAMLCTAPGNLRDNWYKENGWILEKPSQLNKINDCPWYEKKE